MDDFTLEDMEFSNSDKFFLVKPPPPIKECERKKREWELFTYPRITFSKYAQSVYNGDKPGTEKVDYLLYPGCQLSALNPEFVEETYKRLLSRIKEGVGIMLGCCGYSLLLPKALRMRHFFKNNEKSTGKNR